MTQWLGTKGKLCIHTYTVIFATQKILSKKGLPYEYKKIGLDELKNLTMDELNHVYKEAVAIRLAIRLEKFRRGNEFPKQ